jgi:hypothetical protein
MIGWLIKIATQRTCHDLLEGLVRRRSGRWEMFPAPLNQRREAWWAVLGDDGSMPFSHQLLHA